MRLDDIVDALLEGELPQIGNRIELTTGIKAEVIDVGPFNELKRKYPNAAQKALNNSTAPESSFKTAWVIKDDSGELWINGSHAMRMFIKQIIVV